jgi:hypothetical protein
MKLRLWGALLEDAFLPISATHDVVYCGTIGAGGADPAGDGGNADGPHACTGMPQQKLCGDCARGVSASSPFNNA